MNHLQPPSSRRRFLANTSLLATGAALLPNIWLSKSGAAPRKVSANGKLNIAVIGAGGRGGGDTDEVKSENIVALCDVDWAQAEGQFKKFPDARKFKDFRKMLEEMKDGIDAVVVATPDHTHAVASVMAMKMGKHCYCEKPLTRSIHEARVMREVAQQMGVATQMGNQGTANPGLRKGVEIIRSGAIGPVREVHVWTNRPVWPQGVVGRPTDQPAVPSTLDWDLWLGPAPLRPYHPAYVPFKWRGWFDFGTGAIGDMACHTANLAFMALKLGYPTSAEAMVSTDTNLETYAGKSIIRYEFPARGDMPAVTYYWYDGGNRPPRYVGNGVKLPEKLSDSGLLLVGDKGVLFSPNDYGAEFTLMPEQDFKDYVAPAQTIPRSPGHHIEWIQACKGGPVAMSNFDYSGPFTEAILVGTLAVRAREKVLWDGAAMRVTNNEALNRLVKPEYRPGWSL